MNTAHMEISRIDIFLYATISVFRENAMHYSERIQSSPSVMLGKPVIKGTRITVELILKKLSEGMPQEELLQAYTHLSREDIMAAISYSADVISREEMIVS